jgi:hypothetical protein
MMSNEQEIPGMCPVQGSTFLSSKAHQTGFYDPELRESPDLLPQVWGSHPNDVDRAEIWEPSWWVAWVESSFEVEFPSSFHFSHSRQSSCVVVETVGKKEK